MKKYLLIGLWLMVLGWPFVACSQQVLDFRQFYLTPYFYNPAYAGSSGYTQITLAYRQQWVDFPDSPTAAGFAVEHPSGERMAVGLRLLTQQTLGLRTSIVSTGASYAVSVATDHTLNFGLTGGIRINTLDLEGRDYSNDPLILNAAQNEVEPVASAGLLYKFKQLEVGIALMNLFNHQQRGTGILKTHRLEHLLNQLISVRYKTSLSSEVALEPLLLYRLNRDEQNYWSLTAIIHYKEKLFSGLSFQQHQGLSVLAGAVVKERFIFSYNVEFPTGNSVFNASSHELQMQYRFGKKREPGFN